MTPREQFEKETGKKVLLDVAIYSVMSPEYVEWLESHHAPAAEVVESDWISDYCKVPD